MTIQFHKYNIYAALFSISLTILGVVLYVQKGGFSYNVDFTGGTEILFRFQNKEDAAAIKQVIQKDWNGSVYNIVEANEIIVRVQQTPDKVEDLDKKIQASINSVSQDNPAQILQTNSISSTVGESLKWNSLIAISIGLLLMLLYIALRFQFAFAMGAIISLAHDALAILTFFLFFDKEISIDVIGAIMAILGYSINDTIIIFTRIRENLSKDKQTTLDKVVDQSINQTLRRTILTSFATTLVVLAQVVFGGSAIQDLSLALLIGIVFGTYSSIFIASPVMMLFYNKK
ncbi:protein translocase subunit SecF [bacterium]|nr:protein translocase subunit SecF [bacterium]NBX78505.1 protein translocase subunit SecF [bacterium]